MKKNIILENVDQAVTFFETQGVKPTLRTLFYYLVSREIIPNTTAAYKHLSHILVNARKEGRYAWDFLEDKTRVVLGDLSDGKFSDGALDDFKDTARDHLRDLDLDELLNEYFDYLVPWFSVGTWADQPIVAEIWIEKEALASTIQSWLTELVIPIRINRGYSSWTFIYQNVGALTGFLERHEKIIIYYLGDLDPSGVDIQRFLTEALEYFGLDPEKVDLRRLAITGEQVERFNLPPRPQDSETLAKLQRDTRMRSYTEQYIVELDALVAFAPGDFREIVQAAIRGTWDRAIYEDLREKGRTLRSEAEAYIGDIKDQARDKILRQIRGD